MIIYVFIYRVCADADRTRTLCSSVSRMAEYMIRCGEHTDHHRHLLLCATRMEWIRTHAPSTHGELLLWFHHPSSLPCVRVCVYNAATRAHVVHAIIMAASVSGCVCVGVEHTMHTFRACRYLGVFECV